MKIKALACTLLASLLLAPAFSIAHPGSNDGIAKPSQPPAGDLGVSRYGSVVRLRAGLVTHAHQPALSKAGPDLGPPAEIWYVASVKPVAGSQWRYCVSPRLELPGDRDWAPNVTVTLTGSRLPGGNPVDLASVTTHRVLPAGASIELASSTEWCVVRSAGDQDTPPQMSLATDHGRKDVMFPDKAPTQGPKGRSNLAPVPSTTLEAAPKRASTPEAKAARGASAAPNLPLPR